MSDTSPEELGFDTARLNRIGEVVSEDIEQEVYDGAVLCVSRGGQTAMLEAFGYADRDAGVTMEADRIFVSLSMAKQLTGVMALNRVERGDLTLTMKVAEVIPEFGRRGKEHITLYQLLTQTAGLQLGPPPVSPEKMGDLASVVAGICDSPVETVPGTSVHYSALCAHAIIAEMVRRVEGRDIAFREIMRRDLFEPLGMKETALGRRADLAPRVCPVVPRYASEGLFDPAGIVGLDMLLTETAEIPAGGYVTTASDMNIFVNMLLNGGEWNGVRILSPAMINLIMTNQTGDKVNGLWSYTKATKGWDEWPAYLGLGFFLRGDGIFPHWFGSMASPETFGGMGSGSTMFWVDPDKDLTFVFLSTGVIEDSDHILRCQRVSDLVHASLTS